MRRVKEVLRLRFGLGLQQNQIARSCSIGQATVHRYLQKAVAAGLNWPLPDDLDGRRLDELLFRLVVGRPRQVTRALPDFAEIRRQLQTHKHLQGPHAGNAWMDLELIPVALNGLKGTVPMFNFSANHLFLLSRTRALRQRAALPQRGFAGTSLAAKRRWANALAARVRRLCQAKEGNNEGIANRRYSKATGYIA
jgi:hypothetical protein